MTARGLPSSGSGGSRFGDLTDILSGVDDSREADLRVGCFSTGTQRLGVDVRLRGQLASMLQLRVSESTVRVKQYSVSKCTEKSARNCGAELVNHQARARDWRIGGVTELT